MIHNVHIYTIFKRMSRITMDGLILCFDVEFHINTCFIKSRTDPESHVSNVGGRSAPPHILFTGCQTSNKINNVVCFLCKYCSYHLSGQAVLYIFFKTSQRLWWKTGFGPFK